ncbi:hypothetical protein GLOIN_2v1761319 [Rhizophagus clarus]|uniref:Uncharacterized protein n=1 Tax=Rhizophagus clarus TaxID=94130 RepID=A0A8H3R0P6_9GLOM|nr:hypothetical protein GLOIN_2v1761319 [Rhizophagus clarus]
MSSKLFIKLLNRSPKYTFFTYPIYPTFLSFHLIKKNSFKPTFYIKNPYSSIASLSSSSTPNKESTLKKYSPYIYSYFIWVTFGSLLLHLKWSKMSYNEYKEKMQLKIAKLEETIAILENGENVDNNNLYMKKRINSDNELDEQRNNTIAVDKQQSSIKWI